MGIVEFLLMLLIAGICGSIAQGIVGYSRGGCLTSIALGFIGALFGSWLADALNLPAVLTLQFGPNSFPVLWSIVGAALFVAVIAFISGGNRHRF